FQNNMAQPAKDPVQPYRFGAAHDKYRSYHVAEIIARPDIEVYKLSNAQTIHAKRYASAASYVVPATQKQYRLIKSIFEKRPRFQDSLFYDISSWTLPLAFALDFDEVKTPSANLQGDKFDPSKKPLGKIIGGKTEYAYVFETYSYYAPRALYRLLSKGIRVKVANHAFHNSDGKKFAPGSILIPLGIQEKSTDLVED